jgi:hypothetical protein
MVWYMVAMGKRTGRPPLQRVRNRMISIPRTADFDIDGSGAAHAWQQASWLSLAACDGQSGCRTQARLLHSAEGLYVLGDCEDAMLAATRRGDQGELYLDDVFTLFLQTDRNRRIYLEYDLSPLGDELLLMIVNDGQRQHGWQPWRQASYGFTRKAVRVRGGRQEPGATITGWTCEAFIPWKLLTGMGNLPIHGGDGTAWLNLARIDNAGGKGRLFSAATLSRPYLHDCGDFLPVRFE